MQRPVRKLAAPAALRFECGARNPLEPNERERTYERGTASFEYSSESPWTNHLVSGERAPCFPVQSALFLSSLSVGHSWSGKKEGREGVGAHTYMGNEAKPCSDFCACRRVPARLHFIFPHTEFYCRARARASLSPPAALRLFREGLTHQLDKCSTKITFFKALLRLSANPVL